MEIGNDVMMRRRFFFLELDCPRNVKENTRQKYHKLLPIISPTCTAPPPPHGHPQIKVIHPSTCQQKTQLIIGNPRILAPPPPHPTSPLLNVFKWIRFIARF